SSRRSSTPPTATTAGSTGHWASRAARCAAGVRSCSTWPSSCGSRRPTNGQYECSMATTEGRVFAPIEDAIEDIRQGKFVVVVDAADRENEGDLTIAAQFATPEAVNFMAKHARGLVCLCLTPERVDELGLRMMTDHNETPFET